MSNHCAFLLICVDVRIPYTVSGLFLKTFTRRIRLEGEGKIVRDFDCLSGFGRSDLLLLHSKCGLLYFQRRGCQGGKEHGH